MSYALLENGNIRRMASVYDPATELHYAVPNEIEPCNPDYPLAARWLSDDQADRALAILAEYRRSHAQAS